MSAAGQRERAGKKKEKAAGCVSYPPGPFLGGSTSVLRAGYCTVQYLRNTMRVLCELAIA